MTLKRECNYCEPLVETLERAYYTAEEATIQRKQNDFLDKQQESGCTTERICLPGARLRTRTIDLLEPDWNINDTTLLIRSAGSLK
jgi:hypothetical protein